MPHAICARCKQIVIPADGGAVVTIQRVGERETKRLIYLTCADRIVEALRGRVFEMTAEAGR